MSETGKEAIFKPAMVLMSGRALGMVAAFAIPMVLARIFTQSEFGAYKQLFLIFTTLFVAAQMGMAESLYYFLPQEKRRRGRYIFNALLMLSLLGGAIFGILWWQQERVASLLNNEALVDYIPYVGLYLWLMLMAVVLEIVMTVRKQHLGASCTYAASDLARAVLYLAPALVFGSLQWLLIGAIAFAATRFLAALIYLVKDFRGMLRPSGKLMKRHLGYALPFGLAALLEIVQANFHLYAVSWYFDAATFAIYAVGCLQIPVVDFLMTSTANVMMVQMGEKARAGKQREVRELWLDATRKLALILLPVVGGMLVVAHELIVLLFTDTYAGSVPVFMIWTVTMMFTALLTDGVLRVHAQTRFLILQNFIRLVVIAAGIHFFLNAFGLLGAVLITLVATLITKVIALARVKHVIGASFAELLPWGALGRIVLMAAAAALPALLVKAFLDLPMLGTFLLSGFLYVLSYFLMLLAWGPMDGEEKAELLRLTRLPLGQANRTWRQLKPGTPID